MSFWVLFGIYWLIIKVLEAEQRLQEQVHRTRQAIAESPTSSLTGLTERANQRIAEARKVETPTANTVEVPVCVFCASPVLGLNCSGCGAPYLLATGLER